MYNSGEFIKWYEYYACGTVCSDAGYGIIIKQFNVNGYLILKNGKHKLQFFEAYNIEKIQQ